ncbi:MAG: DUF1573 domain-containing protein [Bacteroidota bacterium]|jgi:hypothetical protein|nr:DUF1573 domain-containing protein [Bacteroidota bacterium]
MKKIFAIIACISFSMAIFAQTNLSNVSKKSKVDKKVTSDSKVASPNTTLVNQPSVPTESLSLVENEYDFGKIPQGKPVTHVFEFTNTGATPFALDNVQASCGCTTPVWDKDVVAPGATAKITIGYNAANEGPFTKPVTITYKGNLVKQITIKGDVWKTPVTSAPENTAINSLTNEQ